ncbi:putative flavin-containing monooxygenase 1 [Hibiscus syriacus]|uniref:Flavin-containing monooxygenase n=1 Tax=Hibiscus syriacus TaxID=106335 RepID=A0A6A3C441_HIBSY|nr:putative flavin-containing monooxygenase 1 [Hibiscus syriacus]
MADDNPPLIISKIGIIGAGVSGIAAAKQLSHHNPVVFEATDSVGGVWKTCAYNSTKLQSARKDYEFSDFSWPNRDDPSFPTHVEIVDYLESYAKHFDVLKFVKFNSKVTELRFVGNPGTYVSPFPGHPVWQIAVQTNGSEILQWYAFEFVVVCIGKYGDIPKIPKFQNNKGPEVFQGKVLHSLDYCKLDKEAATQLLKGKKVAVIGYKKSAIDLAVECAEANQGPEGEPCTMVVRTLHWTVPHYWVWGLPFFLFYSTRSSQFLHERPNQGILRTLLCYLLSPLADKGNIVFKKSSNWWFCKEGIQFDDDTKMKADVVILATGYDGKKKLKTILPDPFRSLIEYHPSGIMPLYRGTIHPFIPNMAFVGYIESVANLHTSEIRSMWLARYVDEKFKLPSAENMLGQIYKEMEVSRRITRFYKRHCISTFSINHSDEICEEMGWNSWRKRSWFAEAFSPYGSQDYSDKN